MAGPDDASAPAPPVDPRIPARLVEGPFPDDLDPEYPDPDGLALVDAEILAPDARTLSMGRCSMTGGRIGTDPDTPVDLTDCVLVDADLSGVVIAGLSRVRFTRCRLTGAALHEATVRDVSFDDCALDLVVARAATMERVAVIGGRIDGLDLTDARIGDAELRDVAVRDVALDGAWLVRVDLTGADLADVEAPEHLRGATVSMAQTVAFAPRLARRIGMHVRAPADHDDVGA